METSAKKSSGKSAARGADTRIQAAYMDYVLNHGHRPASVFKFCTDLGIKEETFYDHFGSF